MSKITIKRAMQSDIPVLESILLDTVNWLNETGQPLWGVDEIKWDALSRDNKIGDFYIAYTDGVPSGCMALVDYAPFFWPDIRQGESLFIHKLAVRKTARKSGAADALIEFFKEQGVECGVKTLRLDTHALRPKLRTFYERHGFVFVEVKVLKGERHTAFYIYTFPETKNRVSYISNEILSLVEYSESDDRSLYEDWLDPDTQKGYNGVHVTTFEDFRAREIRQRFFAMIRLDSTGEIIGAVGISPPETIPDLAIWVFEPYRRKGYGTSAFALATKYTVEELKINELHAGAYPDNTGSLKMLAKCGYVPFPAGNVPEKHHITGEDIVQMDFIYSPIAIRLAVPSDAPEMAEVNIRSWEVAYKDIIPEEYIKAKNATRHALYERVITAENANSYVIQYTGKTIGIMKAAPPQDDDLGDDYYELHYIYLHPDYFRMGIGTQAMEFACEKARSVGKAGMIVWVLDENVNSIRFYENCGFHTDGRIMNSEYGKENGRIRMRRDL